MLVQRSDNQSTDKTCNHVQIVPRDWLSLPSKALEIIMQAVPVKQRVGQCALVCRSWASAAAAVTDSIMLDRDADITDGSLQLYLASHGDSITQLHVPRLGRPARWGELTEIPCPNLKDLLLQVRLSCAATDETTVQQRLMP